LVIPTLNVKVYINVSDVQRVWVIEFPLRLRNKQQIADRIKLLKRTAIVASE
jgi:hypothetical protein